MPGLRPSLILGGNVSKDAGTEQTYVLPCVAKSIFLGFDYMKEIVMDFPVGFKDFNTLVICAFRYALGRRTYIAQEAAELILRYRPHLESFTVSLITREILNAIETNNYGMELDKEVWVKLLDELRDKE